MSDTQTSSNNNVAPAMPPKKSGKLIWLVVLLVLFAGSLAFFTVSPWLTHINPAADSSGGNTALQPQIDALYTRMQQLESRVDGMGTAPEATKSTEADTAKVEGLAHVQNDLSSLSSAMTALQQEVKATGTTATEAREASAGLVASLVAFIQLRDAEATGRPFTSELALLRDVSKSNLALQAEVAGLEPYAANGVATLATLRDELMQREALVATAVAKGAAQSWWERVLAELRSLVNIHPVHSGEGDALAQLEASMSKGGAGAVETAFKQLPADAQLNLADWHKRLEDRQHVDEGMAVIMTQFTSTVTAKAP